MCVWKRNQVTDFGYIHIHSPFSKFPITQCHVSRELYNFFEIFFSVLTAIALTRQQFPRETMSSEMQDSDADFRSFSYEEEPQRAKWFKEDLEKGK